MRGAGLLRQWKPGASQPPPGRYWDLPCSSRKVSGSLGRPPSRIGLGQRPRFHGNGHCLLFSVISLTEEEVAASAENFETMLKSPPPGLLEKNTGHSVGASASLVKLCHRSCVFGIMPAWVGGSGKLIMLTRYMLGDKEGTWGFYRLWDHSMQFGLCHHNFCCFMFYFFDSLSGNSES